MDLENIGWWIAIPTIRLTERSQSRALRIIGVLLMFPLFPLAIIGGIILVSLLIIALFKEI